MSGRPGIPAPLLDVAPDARPLIAAFRESGAVSFQDRTVPEARSAYRASCDAGAPSASAGISATTHDVPGTIPLSVTLYRPPGADRAEPAPAVVFFHGGGWVIGDVSTHDALCRVIAELAGTIVVSVDYRLAPESVFPAAHDDASRAAAWILQDGERLGVAVDRVSVVGDSAGGNLAAHVARLSALGLLPGKVRSQVLFYPVTDLTMRTPSYSRVASGFPLSAPSMRWFADLYAPELSTRDGVELSPALHPVPADSAPAFITTVGHDPLADEGIAYAGLLAAAGTAVEHHHLPHHAHGLVTSAGLIATGRDILDRAARFLRDTLHDRSEHTT
jgi:acetyl esterase